MPRKKKAEQEPEVPATTLTENQIKFLESLRENLGIVSKAAASCGMHRNSHFNWMKQNPEYKDEVEAIYEECIDVVENALMDKILQYADSTAIIFFLKTKGKKRGYVERQEFEHQGKLIVRVPGEETEDD